RYYLFFFFQAEDGIRDFHVTGVQTCALPISNCLRTLLYFAAQALKRRCKLKPIMTGSSTCIINLIKVSVKSKLVPLALRNNCIQDRKSTRLNSSHVKISYAVFCLNNNKHHSG